MDIKQIGVSHGQNQNFMDLVHESMVEKCKRYVQKSKGPTNIFKNLDGRTPIDFVKDAFKPLEQFKNKIGVVIDGSTTRGFAVPSQASLYSQELGIKPQQAFDVVEACNGFARAIETAYMLFETKPELSDKYILIINNEQPPETRAILPKDVKDYKSVASYYVGLTFSHVCACTLLEKTQNKSWKFHHYTKTDLATNINIPLPQLSKGYEPQPDPYEISHNDDYGQFCIPAGHDLEKKAMFVLSTIERNVEFYKKANVITHTFSHYVYERFLEHSNINQLCLYYNEAGNLGSASLPFIIHDQYLSKRNGSIPVGQNIAFLGHGAGGSSVQVEFQNRQISKTNEIYDPCTEKKIMNTYYILGVTGLRKQLRKLFLQFKDYEIVTWTKSDIQKSEAVMNEKDKKKLSIQNKAK